MVSFEQVKQRGCAHAGQEDKKIDLPIQKTKPELSRRLIVF